MLSLEDHQAYVSFMYFLYVAAQWIAMMQLIFWRECYAGSLKHKSERSLTAVNLFECSMSLWCRLHRRSGESVHRSRGDQGQGLRPAARNAHLYTDLSGD